MTTFLKHNIILVLAAYLFSTVAMGQTAQPIKASLKDLSRSGETFKLACNIEVDSIKIKEMEALVIAPELSDGENSYTLPRIVLNGARRQKLFLRQEYFDNKNEIYSNAYKILPYEGKAIAIDYSTNIPYKDWMSSVKLILRQEKCNCPNEKKIMDDIVVDDSAMKQVANVSPEQLELHISFMAPAKEEVKIRSEYGESFVGFKVSRSDIIPEFMENKNKLDQVAAFFKKAEQDKNITVNSITISGYTSPEGTYDYNMGLSKRRAKAFADWVKRSFSFPEDIYKVEWHGEDWAGLRKMVKEGNMEDKERILNIIDNVRIFAGREKKLMIIKKGVPYDFMLKNYFPHLRRTVYRIEYTVRSFSLEESRELIDSAPEMLSLFEMYEAAKSFGKDSEKFLSIIKKASENPDADPAMKNNAAAMALEESRLEDAEALLSQIPDGPEKLNNMGVVKMLCGDYEQAEMYFRAAEQLGSEDASKNIEVLVLQMKKLGRGLRTIFDPEKTSKTIPYILKSE